MCEDVNLLSNWSCYELGSSVELLVPTVRALAFEETYNASAQSIIAMFVENIGNIKLDGFEVRYMSKKQVPVFSAIIIPILSYFISLTNRSP